MGKKMKLGLVQVHDDFGGDLHEREAILLREAEECYKDGADLVFFPEAYQHVADRDIVFRPTDLRREHDSFKADCSALAKKYHSYIVPWDYDVDGEGRVYNMSYVIDRDGNEIGQYRKVQLTFGEYVKRLNDDGTTWGLTRGDSFPVFELDFGKVGIMICYDNYFPESARCLALNGAELILYPLYGDTLNPQWEMKTRVRSMDNQVYIAPCRIDRTDYVFTGVVDPLGYVISRLPNDTTGCHRVVEIDLGKRVHTHLMNDKHITEDLGYLLNATRNPSAYSDITKEREVKTWDECYLGNAPWRK